MSRLRTINSISRYSCVRHYTLTSRHNKVFGISQQRFKNTFTALNNDFERKLQDIIGDFHAPIRFCIGYGSGVFPQRGANPKDEPMIDFIFAVTHPQHWHSLNIRDNHRNDYSFMKYFGSKAIQLLQDNFGAGIYYNTNCIVQGVKIKYGVISVDTLIADLMDWNTMYVAGRLHKPVKFFRYDARIRIAQEHNLNSAVRTALYHLPVEFTEEELFLKITSLSYTGDFRMDFFGENPHKMHNIVYNQMDHFREVYSDSITRLPNISYKSEGKLQQDDNPRVVALSVRNLPSSFRERLINFHLRKRSESIFYKEKYLKGTPDEYNDQEDIEMQKFSEIALDPNFKDNVQKALIQTVRLPSIKQAMKGIITAGLGNSVVYVGKKMSKAAKQQK